MVLLDESCESSHDSHAVDEVSVACSIATTSSAITATRIINWAVIIISTIHIFIAINFFYRKSRIRRTRSNQPVFSCSFIIFAVTYTFMIFLCRSNTRKSIYSQRISLDHNNNVQIIGRTNINSMFFHIVMQLREKLLSFHSIMF